MSKSFFFIIKSALMNKIFGAVGLLPEWLVNAGVFLPYVQRAKGQKVL